MNVQVRTGDSAFVVKQVSNVLASEGPLTIVVKGGAEATARIRGRLVDPQGNPVAAAVGHLVQAGGSGGVGVAVNLDGSFEISKLRAGAYGLKITAPNAGVWNSSTLRVETGETLDLGAVVIPKPGTLVVVVNAPDALKKARYMVEVRQETARGGSPVVFEFAGSQSTPQLLQPGRHAVHVHTFGPDPAIATRDVRVEIRSGEETRIDMAVLPGAMRTLEFTLPPDAPPMDDGVEVIRVVVKDGAGTLELDVDAPYFDERAIFGVLATFAKGAHKYEALTTRGFRASGEFTIDAPSSASETLRAVLSR
jgi:hypothetical protein